MRQTDALPLDYLLSKWIRQSPPSIWHDMPRHESNHVHPTDETHEWTAKLSAQSCFCPSSLPPFRVSALFHTLTLPHRPELISADPPMMDLSSTSPPELRRSSTGTLAMEPSSSDLLFDFVALAP